MSWKTFQSAVLKINLVVLALGWICFWGYGLVVGDIPPLSVILPLAALSACAVLAISVGLFVLAHLYLATRGALKAETPSDPRARQVSILTAIGIGFLILLGFADHSGGGVADAILIPAAVLIGCGVLCGLIYALTAYGGQMLRWQFHKEVSE